MPSENVKSLRIELLAARGVLEPQIEGLADFDRLNLHPDTKAKVEEVHTNYVRRLNLINATLDALTNLEVDNFPDTPNLLVLKSIYEDLQDNVNTIEAAFAKFLSAGHISLGVSAGSPEPK